VAAVAIARQGLISKQSDERLIAVQLLGLIKREFNDENQLIGMIDDSDNYVRNEVEAVLNQITLGIKHIPALKLVLNSKNSNTRLTAVEQIGRVEDPDWFDLRFGLLRFPKG
jgi:HEAT repeat protein